MRLSLLDLLIAIAAGAIGCFVAGAFVPVKSGAGIVLSVSCGMIAYLVLSSPLYRLLHFYPLLLPRCPFCRDRDRSYYTLARNWPVETIECANCRERIELCCDVKFPRSPSALPRFDLLWPHSFGGRWRRVS